MRFNIQHNRLDCFTSSAAKLTLLNPPASACGDSLAFPSVGNP